jgi:hypothetical protein
LIVLSMSRTHYDAGGRRHLREDQPEDGKTRTGADQLPFAMDAAGDDRGEQRTDRVLAFAFAIVCHCMLETASGPPQASGT